MACVHDNIAARKGSADSHDAVSARAIGEKRLGFPITMRASVTETLRERRNVGAYQNCVIPRECGRENPAKILSGLFAKISQRSEIPRSIQIFEIVDVVTIRATHLGSRSGTGQPVKPSRMADQCGARSQFDDLAMTQRHKVPVLFAKLLNRAIHLRK